MARDKLGKAARFVQLEQLLVVRESDDEISHLGWDECCESGSTAANRMVPGEFDHNAEHIDEDGR